MAKIGSLPHHASKSMGTAHTPPATPAPGPATPALGPATPSLVEAAHTPVAVPTRTSVADSDATRVDTSSASRRDEPEGESFGDKVSDVLEDFSDDFKK